MSRQPNSLAYYDSSLDDVRHELPVPQQQVSPDQTQPQPGAAEAGTASDPETMTPAEQLQTQIDDINGYYESTQSPDSVEDAEEKANVTKSLADSIVQTGDDSFTLNGHEINAYSAQLLVDNAAKGRNAWRKTREGQATLAGVLNKKSVAGLTDVQKELLAKVKVEDEITDDAQALVALRGRAKKALDLHVALSSAPRPNQRAARATATTPDATGTTQPAATPAPKPLATRVAPPKAAAPKTAVVPPTPPVTAPTPPPAPVAPVPKANHVRTADQDALLDLGINIDARGMGHRERGKVISKDQLAQVKAHAETIRDGLANWETARTAGTIAVAEVVTPPSDAPGDMPEALWQAMNVRPSKQERKLHGDRNKQLREAWKADKITAAEKGDILDGFVNDELEKSMLANLSDKELKAWNKAPHAGGMSANKRVELLDAYKKAYRNDPNMPAVDADADVWDAMTPEQQKQWKKGWTGEDRVRVTQSFDEGNGAVLVDRHTDAPEALWGVMSDAQQTAWATMGNKQKAEFLKAFTYNEVGQAKFKEGWTDGQIKKWLKKPESERKKDVDIWMATYEGDSSIAAFDAPSDLWNSLSAEQQRSWKNDLTGKEKLAKMRAYDRIRQENALRTPVPQQAKNKVKKVTFEADDLKALELTEDEKNAWAGMSKKEKRALFDARLQTAIDGLDLSKKQTKKLAEMSEKEKLTYVTKKYDERLVVPTEDLTPATLRGRVSKIWKRAKDSTHMTALNLLQIRSYSDAKEYFNDPEHGRRRHITAVAAGALVAGAVIFGLYELKNSGNSSVADQAANHPSTGGNNPIVPTHSGGFTDGGPAGAGGNTVPNGVLTDNGVTPGLGGGNGANVAPPTGASAAANVAPSAPNVGGHLHINDGETLWGAMDKAGVPDGEIKQRLIDAATKSHMNYNIIGTPDNWYFELNGQTDPHVIAEMLGDNLKI